MPRGVAVTTIFGWGWLAALVFAGLLLSASIAHAAESTVSAGRLVFHDDLPSHHVAPRRIAVWLPEGYEQGDDRYAVIYMHDGQNLFDAATTSYGHEWGVDEVVSKLMRQGKLPRTIVVGIWNTPDRWKEYTPAKVLDRASWRTRWTIFANQVGRPVSDAYLRYVVEEVKPFMDHTYRTKPDPDHTITIGSSSGALIAAYTLLEYPQVFGGAASMSAHWRSVGTDFQPWWQGEVTPLQAMIDYVAGHFPADGAHRLYFDHGTKGPDASYPPEHARMAAALTARGLVADRDYMARGFEGAEHNEQSWRARLDTPLLYLLGDRW